MRLVGESIHCDEWWGQHHHISTVDWSPVWFATAKKQLHTVDDDIGDSVGDDDSCLKNQRMIPRFYFTPTLAFFRTRKNIGSEFPQRTFKFRLAAWVGKKLSMTPWPDLIRPCGSHQTVFHEAVHRPLHSGFSLRWSVSPGISASIYIYIYIHIITFRYLSKKKHQQRLFNSLVPQPKQSNNPYMVSVPTLTIEISQMWVHIPVPWMILLMVQTSETTTCDVNNPSFSSGIEYQPELVIAGFLNHQRYGQAKMTLFLQNPWRPISHVQPVLEKTHHWKPAPGACFVGGPWNPGMFFFHRKNNQAKIWMVFWWVWFLWEENVSFSSKVIHNTTDP